MNISLERKQIGLLILIMAAVSLAVAVITISILYKTAVNEERARLVDTTQSQARLMEAVARFDRMHQTETHISDPTEATLSQIREAHASYEGFGETGELVLARRDGDEIVFLLSHRHDEMDVPRPLPFNSEFARPMRRALLGQSGTIIGQDYRGEIVLAAYEPVAELNLGVVAKIDMSEIRAPFIAAGVMALLISLILVGVGAWLFQYTSNPLIQRIRRNEEKLKEAQKIAGMGSWEWDITHGKISWSEQLYNVLGLQTGHLEPSFKAFIECVHPDERVDIRQLIARSIRIVQPFSKDFRIIRPDGEMRWVHGEGQTRPGDERHREWFGTIQDITERKQAENQVRQMAYYDPLTGLPNRSLFYDRIKQAIAQSSRSRTSMAVLFLDLDYFKPINDELGHEYGDEALTEIGKRLQQCVREVDTVARIGGDEFSIILGEVSSESAACLVAEKIITSVMAPMVLKEAQYSLGISIGICITTSKQDDDVESIMRMADAAMYQAKTSGRNRYCVYQATGHDISDELNEALQLERSLRRALEKDEFEIFYQPKVDLKDGQIIGMHALLRWNSPDSGLILPDTFVPLAVRTGLIVPIGEWVLRQACSQNAAWQAEGLQIVPVSVNTTAEQLKRGDFVAMVSNILSESNLDAEMLQLEISESDLMQYGISGIEVLDKLSELGIKITVGNFGTGFFSLQALKSLPIHELKMNRALVKHIHQKDDKESIAHAIIDMGHTLSHQVVAEGVETEDQLGFLRKHESDGMLGYLTSPPVPSNEVAKQLKNRKLGFGDHQAARK